MLDVSIQYAGNININILYYIPLDRKLLREYSSPILMDIENVAQKPDS
jgi:hypothetical protein